MKIINPTGRGLRNDEMGSGNYGAGRGRRYHQGYDFLCKPGQEVIAPIAGLITRTAYPYAGNRQYLGLVLQGEWCEVKLFYVKIKSWNLVRKRVKAGDVIGIAQDISDKYGPGCLPHVHLEMRVDPALFLEGEK